MIEILTILGVVGMIHFYMEIQRKGKEYISDFKDRGNFLIEEMSISNKTEIYKTKLKIVGYCRKIEYIESTLKSIKDDLDLIDLRINGIENIEKPIEFKHLFKDSVHAEE